MRGDPRVYTVRITMLEEYEAWVVAPDAFTAKHIAENGGYESVYATGAVLRRTVHQPKLVRDMTPEDVPRDY